MAHPFSLDSLEFTGDPVPITTEVPGGAISWGGAQFGASDADVLVHLRGVNAAQSVLTWRDRDGKALATVGGPDGYWEPSLSHDGNRLAVGIGTDASDIWVFDLERDSRTRLTFDSPDDRTPLWSPDDSQLAYSSAHNAEGEIWIRPSSGQGEAEVVFTTDTSIVLTDWSSDGNWIFFDSQQLIGDNDLDIWILDMRTSEARPHVSGRFVQRGACLSADGKWLAFQSNESGRSEIYVQRFPEGDERQLVSNDGGSQGAYQAVWSDDGSELFYQRNSMVMAVPVKQGPGFSVGSPKTLFGVTVKSGPSAGIVITNSGQRVLLNELPPADPSKSGARLIQNWSKSLQAQ
jgi:dipeptidyl aminopeptidase/acylaminoacyl peptidase